MHDAIAYFENRPPETIRTVSFRKLLDKALDLDPLFLKLTVGKPGLSCLYFNKDDIMFFLRSQLTERELFDKNGGDALVRNIHPMESNGNYVDPDALWLKRGDACVLVDDDDFFTAVLYDPLQFRTIE